MVITIEDTLGELEKILYKFDNDGLIHVDIGRVMMDHQIQLKYYARRQCAMKGH